MRLIGTIVAALTGAVRFAVSAVLQQQSARVAPSSESLHLRLLVGLAHRRRWLAGVGRMSVAYGVESLALALGNVTLVEPVVVTELVLALLPCAGAVGCTLLLARRARPWARAGLLGAGAGIAFGLLAVLTPVPVGIVERRGAVEPLGAWEPYLLLALGLGGFLLSQSAYQAAPLTSSLPFVDALEPVTAVVIAATILGEHVDLSPPDLAVEALGAVLAIAGVFLLGRSPVVIATYQAEHAEEGLATVPLGDVAAYRPEPLSPHGARTPPP